MNVIERAAPDRHDPVRSLPILQLLPEPLRELVVESFEVRPFGFGDYIVVEGDPSDAFYVMTEGFARMLGRGPAGEEVSLDILRPGDSFGERGLLEGMPRARSVRASGPVAAARLDVSVFRSLVCLHPDVRSALQMQARAKRVQDALRTQHTFCVLGPSAVALMLKDGEEHAVTAGERICTEGEPATRWWAVLDGRLTAFTGEPARRDVRYLRTGDIFGELGLLQDTPRAASVEASTGATLLEFPASTFHALLGDSEFRCRIDERLAMQARGPARRPLDFGPPEETTGPAPVKAPPPAADAARVADGVELDGDLELQECHDCCAALRDGRRHLVRDLRDLAGGERAERPELVRVIARVVSRDPDPPAAVKALRDRSIALRPLEAELRELADRGELQDGFTAVLRSLAHMQANRLLKESGGVEELRVHDALARLYAAQLARRRARQPVARRHGALKPAAEIRAHATRAARGVVTDAS